MNKPHARRVFKQGDSLVVTIPAEITRSLDIKEGDEVIVEMNDQAVVLKKFFK